jgi:hypothetical protein
VIVLISRKLKFLFIHVQKSGGCSIREALRSAVPDLEPFLGSHDHARWALPHLGGEWEEYFKFAFVRNPWDRLVSWYSMIREQARPGGSNRLWQYVLAQGRSFDEFVHCCTDVIADVDGLKSFCFNQLEYLTGEDGTLIVDFVGRFETLSRDTARVFERLGLGGLPLPHANRSRHDHYSSFYTDETRRVVAERFARDIAFFGYSFEGPMQTALPVTPGRETDRSRLDPRATPLACLSAVRGQARGGADRIAGVEVSGADPVILDYGKLASGALLVEGWAATMGCSPVLGVYVTVDDNEPVWVTYGACRRDVTEHFRARTCLHTGYLGLLPRRYLGVGSHSLSVHAVLCDNRSFETLRTIQLVVR